MVGQIILFFIIGILIGIILSLIFAFGHMDGVLHVDTTNPLKDLYRFVVLCPMEDLKNKHYILVQIIRDKEE